MKIAKPEIITDENRTILRASCTVGERETALWYSVDRQYGEYLDRRCQDGFLLGMLLLAMRQGEDIYLEGSISERLYYNLTNYVITILRLLIPELHPVAIIPAHLEPEPSIRPGNGVATSFTGGVDSFSALTDHLFGDVPKAYRITHLVMNNTGSHGHGGRTLFQRRYRRLLPLAKELELQFVSVDSNLGELLTFNHQQTSTVRDLAAAMTLPGLFGRYYYPSTYDYAHCYIGPTYGMGYSEPTLVPLLSTGCVEFIPTGSQYSRVEKTARLSEFPLSYRYLDVCTDETGRNTSKNCSICNKCLRTLMTLEVLEKLNLYDAVFDLDKYRQYRKWYLAQVLLRTDTFTAEIADLAVARHYRLHPFPWLLKSIYPVIKPRTMPGFIPDSLRPTIKQLFRVAGCYRW